MRASWAEIAIWRMAGLPVGVLGRKLDLQQDDVDDAGQEVVLLGDVVVQRHGLDPEFVGELAHRERLDPAFVGHGDSGTQHPLPAQGSTGLWGRVGLGHG